MNLVYTADNSKFNHVFVNNVPASQTVNIGQAIDKLGAYLVNPPKTIIEIGTHKGGFTTLLANHPFFSLVPLHTFDIVDMLHKNYVRASNTTHYLENVFATKTVETLIASEGVTVLFCDGGNKIKEFNHFAKFLKPGDLIFCHDYAATREKFNSQIRHKIWDWCEIDYSNIAGSIEEYNLTPVLSDIFEATAWGSFIKI